MLTFDLSKPVWIIPGWFKLLIRCRGRLNNSQLATTSKNPILICFLLITPGWNYLSNMCTLRLSTVALQIPCPPSERDIGSSGVDKLLKIRSCVTCNKLEGLPYVCLCCSYRSPQYPFLQWPSICSYRDLLHQPTVCEGWRQSEKAYIRMCLCLLINLGHTPGTDRRSFSEFIPIIVLQICKSPRLTSNPNHW